MLPAHAYWHQLQTPTAPARSVTAGPTFGRRPLIEIGLRGVRHGNSIISSKPVGSLILLQHLNLNTETSQGCASQILGINIAADVSFDFITRIGVCACYGQRYAANHVSGLSRIADQDLPPAKVTEIALALSQTCVFGIFCLTRRRLLCAWCIHG